MVDLTDWHWGGEYPHNTWVRVLLAHGEDEYAEATARLNVGGTGRYWTMAPGHHIWGPIVGWRELRDGEQP